MDKLQFLAIMFSILVIASFVLFVLGFVGHLSFWIIMIMAAKTKALVDRFNLPIFDASNTNQPMIAALTADAGKPIMAK